MLRSYSRFVLEAPADDNGGAGAGAPPAAPAASPPPANQPPPAAPAGDVAAQLAAANARIAALEAEHATLQPLAADGKAWQTRETARIDAAKATLTKDEVAVLDAQPSLALKSQLLDVFTAAKKAAPTAPAPATPPVAPATPPPQPPPPGGGPPGPGVGIDFAAALAGGEKTWLEAKARDPKGAAEFISKSSQPGLGGRQPLAFLQRGTDSKQ